MKKITLIIFTVFLNAVLFSCSNNDGLIEEQKNKKIRQNKLQAAKLKNCCGEEEDIIVGPPESPKTN